MSFCRPFAASAQGSMTFWDQLVTPAGKVHFFHEDPKLILQNLRLHLTMGHGLSGTSQVMIHPCRDTMYLYHCKLTDTPSTRQCFSRDPFNYSRHCAIKLDELK